jgi:hypothetical protein
MSSTVQKIRANRKVLENNCSICGRGFMLAEEVYQCAACGGFHHVACFDQAGACPLEAQTSQLQTPAQPFIEQPMFSVPQPAAAPPPSTPLTPPPPPAPTPTPAILDPLEAELRMFYSGWSTAQLEEALTVDRGSYKAAHIGVMEAEWAGRGQPPLKECTACRAYNKPSAEFCVRCGGSLKVSAYGQSAPPQPSAPPAFVSSHTPSAVMSPPTSAPLAADEKRCPSCAEIIKKEAVKCRFCGHVLDYRYAQQSTGGGYFEDTGRRLTEDEIKADAKNALILSIVGIFCFGFILEPLALYKGFRTMSRIGQAEREYNNLDIGSARGMAIAAIVIGAIGVLLILFWVVAAISAAGSPPPRHY